MFENKVLRKIFGPKRNEVAGGWRKLHNAELHNLYSSPSIIRMIKRSSQGEEIGRDVLRKGRRGMSVGFWLEIQKERDQ
jgi:hypothetical protein